LSTTTPVFPCSTISITAPRRVEMTGVPQAIASIIISPNGSSQSIGEMSARAPIRSSTLSAWPTSPTYSIEPPRCGRMNSSK
jgi:hypothetical protein